MLALVRSRFIAAAIYIKMPVFLLFLLCCEVRMIKMDGIISSMNRRSVHSDIL